METMEDSLLQRVRLYELEDLLVHVGIFPRLIQHAILYGESTQRLQQLNHAL